MTSLSYGGYNETRTYNNLLQLTRQTIPGVFDTEYVFPTALNGRITSSIDHISGDQVNYTYDALQRLTHAETVSSAWQAALNSWRYVREARLRHKEVFVPLAHPPGDAQADFGEALVVIGGVEQKAHFLCIDLPHSDDSFVMAFPAENTEAFLEGHNQAFVYFGGVPRTILYDNTKIAVKEITGAGERTPTEAFSGLRSHYLFAAKFGRPGKGNDKGNVEGLVGYARRNFMVPVPRVASWEELNTQLVEQCRQRRERKLWGHEETIAQRFERDRKNLRPLPATPLEACQKRTTRASSQALVRFETNDYSVPVAYGHRQVLVKAFVWEVVISCTSEVIARHVRNYGREEMIFDPLHYLALLEQKTNALDQAAPLQAWQLPKEFTELRRQMEVRLGKRGRSTRTFDPCFFQTRLAAVALASSLGLHLHQVGRKDLHLQAAEHAQHTTKPLTRQTLRVVKVRPSRSDRDACTPCIRDL